MNRACGENRISRARAEAATLAEKLQGLQFSFERKAGEEGKLFGSVTTMDIAEQLKEAGFPIDRRSIQLEQPLRSLGEFAVPVRLPASVSADLKVTIVAEE